MSYSADTEILTRRGWLTFDQVTLADEVATRSLQGQFVWHRPAAVAWQPHNGEMVQLGGRCLDVLVTPEHPVLWSPEGAAKGTERLGRAAGLAARGQGARRPRAVGCLPVTSTWDASNLAEKAFASSERAAKGPPSRVVRMTGDQFAAFMGMYIAEGNATRAKNDWLVQISQTANGKGYEEYRQLLIAMFGREPGKGNYGATWVLHSRALYEYLAPFGQSVTKWLPREVLDLSRHQLNLFWEYYFLGDGNYERAAGREDQLSVATASRRLADHLQEVIQKLGWSATPREYENRGSRLMPDFKGTIFKLRLRKTAYPAFGVTTIAYSGMVGSVRMPNETVYVRRNGNPAWCPGSG